jgi:hypothetical protein
MKEAFFLSLPHRNKTSLSMGRKVMNKNRYPLYLLICGLMLYFALPRMSFSSGSDMLFTGAWLLLAFCVVAGNLSAFLYTPKRRAEKKAERKAKTAREQSRGLAG